MSDESVVDSVYDRGSAVCVVGAGGSGLAAIKNLRELGFAVDCYERETGVGGSWNVRHEHSPLHASSHLAVSRLGAQYPDFPMPDDWPDYPHHTLVLSYLERYADHFELRQHIWFGTEVVRLEPVADGSGRWDVTTAAQRGDQVRTMRYAAVVVATGYHRSPYLPDLPGLADFGGRVLHSSGYKDQTQLRGRRVLVIGGGNAGCEIAAEAAGVAATCWHSTRSGRWHVPKYLMGRPSDQVLVRAQASRLPQPLRRRMVRTLLGLTVGAPSRYGLPDPQHPALARPAVAGSAVFDGIGQGKIIPVPEVARFEIDEVRFVDDQVADPNLVIMATGYAPRFDFIDGDLLGGDETGLPNLRWHTLSTRLRTLAVVGLLRPDTGDLACAHWQSVLTARWLAAVADSAATASSGGSVGSGDAAGSGGSAGSGGAAGAADRAGAFWQRTAGADGLEYGQFDLERQPSRRFEISHLRYLQAIERALGELEAVR